MNTQPLADRLRPQSFGEIVGQEHLFGENGILTRMCRYGRICNMIFFGPPGTGKTTAANVIARQSGMPLYCLNATTASLSDVKDVAQQTGNMFGAKGVLLYLDEIQYFNRKQQQSLLEYMEDGRITLIASTTENPYYYIYNAILSRASVFEFKPVTPRQEIPALRRALEMLNADSPDRQVTADDAMLEYVASRGGGDVRRSIGLLENLFYLADGAITRADADSLTPSVIGNFDRSGDVHYDMMSGLQKSIRGSDPNAAVFYLARLLAGGDLISACRRLQVIASEDVGLAYPMAAAIVRACTESAKELGLPEGAIPLANAAVMLATAPKSNSAYEAYNMARQDAEAGRGADVPRALHAPEYKGYLYPHEYPGHWVKQQYLPDDLKDKVYYRFGDNKTEQAARQYFEMIRKNIKPENKQEKEQ